jgi:hypothetical protein
MKAKFVAPPRSTCINTIINQQFLSFFIAVKKVDGSID